jgi:hypothetical protein
MNRQKYVIMGPDGSVIEVWGNGYEVNQAGILSIGQMRQVNGQWVPLLVLSIKAEGWASIHELEEGGSRPSYQAQGTIAVPKGVIQ